MNDPRRERLAWRRVVGFAFVAVAFGFLFYVVSRNSAELRAHEWTLRPGLLAISLAFHVAGLAWGVAVWRLLLARIGARVGFLDLARVWFISGLGRYIPGKVWQFVGAAHLGAGAGLPAAVTVTSLAVHTGIFVIAATVTGVYLLPATLGDPAWVAVRVARWVAPLLLLLVHPAVIRTALALVRRFTRRDLGEWNGRWIDGIGLVVLATGSWVLTGVGFYLFLESITPLEGATVREIIAINALAFVAGYVVFIAPAGLGAKEGALAAMLSLYMPAPVAALVAIATRLWAIAAEVIPALVLLLVPATGPRRPAPADPESRIP